MVLTCLDRRRQEDVAELLAVVESDEEGEEFFPGSGAVTVAPPHPGTEKSRGTAPGDVLDGDGGTPT